MSTLEVRTLVEPVEFRADGTKLVASGVAIRYGSVSKLIGGKFKERIMPGAATKTLQERDVTALHEHDRSMLLGRMSAGTLRITNDERALAYEIDLPDTSYGRDLAVSLERRDISGSSFGFKAISADTKWTVGDDGTALRSVGALMLDHIATTCAPAYDEHTAELAMRSLSVQTGIEVRTLLETPNLATLLAPSDERDDTDDEDDGRETTVDRPHIAWLYS